MTVAGRSREHQPLAPLVHDAGARDLPGHVRGAVAARVVDDQDLVGKSGLREDGMETSTMPLTVSAIAARVLRPHAVVCPRA